MYHALLDARRTSEEPGETLAGAPAASGAYIVAYFARESLAEALTDMMDMALEEGFEVTAVEAAREVERDQIAHESARVLFDTAWLDGEAMSIALYEQDGEQSDATDDAA